jgi:DNA-binding transcriptional MerR regulator
VVPGRSEGGSRRYTAADIERLRLMKAAVDAGHRIGRVARLDDAALRERIAAAQRDPSIPLDDVLDALDALDAPEAQRLLSVQLCVLGPARFARECALPLVCEIGERWTAGRMGIAQEHLATGILRSLRGPRIVFATPSGERHDLGLLMAALTAVGAGANPIYLGAELPVADLLDAVARTDAATLALGLVTSDPARAERLVRELRDALPDAVELWLGGIGAAHIALPARVERFAALDELERRVVRLCLERANDP